MNLRGRLLIAGMITAAVAVPVAWGAALFGTFPIVGGGPYCAASNVQSGAQQTITGTGGLPAFPPIPGVLEGFPGNPPGPNPVVCQSNVPPGPRSFSGNENAPFDLYPPGAQVMAGGAQTALVKVTQLGQGALLDINAPANPAGTPITVPANTGFVVLDSGGDATSIVDLPNPAIDGQIIAIVCNGGAATSLTVQTSSPTSTPPGPQTQTIVPTPTAAACATGTVTRYRFVAQPVGTLVGDTWLRIQ